MSEYDFSTLSPHDFEILSRDLLQKKLKVDLESFKEGKDKGIDLRYSKPKSGNVWIVQAKHYLRSGFSALKSKLKNEEKGKAAKLNPTRYILTTSVSLAPQMKDELLGLLKPYCKSSSDILGKEDLNNLLGRFQDIEKAHFKLWLPSTTVLQRLLNNGIFTQSSLELDKIKHQLSLFVPTAAVDRCLNLLDKHGFCMLTGIPGIGKTTTARLIVAHHLQDDWEGIYLSGQTRDAFKVFEANKKQIFFYDDFLGLTSLQERLAKNEDRDLLQLIKACRKSPSNKRLVLTTRQYLYEQACLQHEVLDKRIGIETAKSVVELGDYTKAIRAQILVNHLYFNGIDPEICRTFVTSGKAGKTLTHPNYNPRIVETMCELNGVNELSGAQFGNKFLAMLNDPEDIWAHAFRNQLSSGARELLLVFAVHGSSVTIQALKHHYSRYVEATGNRVLGFDALFSANLKELDGSFLRVRQGHDFKYLTYHSPAIKDFTDKELIHESRLLEIALKEFSYEGVLIVTAKSLLANHSERITADDLLAAFERADRRTQYSVSEFGNRSILEQTPDRARSLKFWLELILKKGDSSVVKKFFKILEEFFESTDCRNGITEFVVDLYLAYVKATFRFRYKMVFSGDRLRELLLPGCKSPDNFVALTKLLPDGETFDTELKPIQKAFENEYWMWLQDEVHRAGSSNQIRDAIDSVLSASERLRIDEEDLDLFGAEDAHNELARAEDAQAEIRMEEIFFERDGERDESGNADDILGSLGN